MLTATAGTLAYAALEHAPLAVLVVHEFVTNKTDDKRHAANFVDYRSFLQRLAAKAAFTDNIQPLLGPFALPESSAFREIQLFVGKVVTRRRSDEPR